MQISDFSKNCDGLEVVVPQWELVPVFHSPGKFYWVANTPFGQLSVFQSVASGPVQYGWQAPLESSGGFASEDEAKHRALLWYVAKVKSCLKRHDDK